jgi:hypothetical protein
VGGFRTRYSLSFFNCCSSIIKGVAGLSSQQPHP